MTDGVFQREILPLREFLKINTDNRMERAMLGGTGMLATDIKMNDETNEF